MTDRFARLAITAAALLSALALGPAIAGRDATVEAPDAFRGVRGSLEKHVEAGRAASVAVAVVREGQVVWAEGFGLADREAGREATADSIYRLASVSKPITATGLMVLVDRGQIDLDAPANRYLPGETLRAPLGSADDMTIRRLANHTSGLPTHYNFFYDGHSPPPIDETIRRYGFASKVPGERWEYSNLAFGLLGFITETVSETPWSEFLEREVFDPLGMSGTSVRVRPGREADRAVPYARDAAGRFVPVGDYGFDHPGASTIWSSANDLARFARMHLNGGELDGVRVLSPEATTAMQELTGEREPGQGTGIAWAVGTIRGRRCLSHSGGMPGVSTLVRLFPDDDAATIVLINSESYPVTHGISEGLATILFPEVAEAPRADDSHREDDAADEPARWEGSWSGTLAHQDGDIPITLVVDGPDAARITFGEARPAALRDVAVRDGLLHGTIAGHLRTQAFYHGPVSIEFHLDHRGDRLTGVASAVADGYFSVPHWVSLARDEEAPPSTSAADAPEPFDLILAGGRVVDGCGTPWYRADLAVRDGRIAAIGRLDGAAARRTIDASGLVVAPGFIDMMGQTAAPFLDDPRAGDNLLTQGITTINAGEGSSDAPLAGEAADRTGWSTMAGYFAALDREGLPLNMVQTVGHTQVRRLVVGEEDRPATPDELAAMEAHVREAMEAGAIGVSTSLIYPPAVYAPTDEIVALATVAGSYGGRYFTHMRNEGDRLLEAIDEALLIGERAGTPVHIFHLKAAGRDNWPKMAQALARIEAARASGRQVGADIYPYLNNGLGIESFIHPRHSAEGHAALLRTLDDPAARAAIRREMEDEGGWENWYRHIGRDWENVVLNGIRHPSYANLGGRSLAEIARSAGRDPWDAFFEIAGAGAFALPESMSEANKIMAMRREFICFDTDVGPAGGSSIATHPRAFGAFPRVLSRYVRELGVLSLEQAITRMTAVAANELGLHDRGRLAVGLAADVVAFDPDRIRDRATLAEPSLPSEGVRWVLVNGRVVLEDGAATDARPGRVLRGPGHQPRPNSPR